MSLQLVANHLAQKGRGPDSNLVHMSNREVAGLQALAKKHGGSLTINPDTGLPEAGILDSLLPTIAGGALTYFSGGAITPMMSAGIIGGISALDSKDLGKGLMAGLGAYGGAGLTQGLMGAGLGAVGPELSAQAAADATAQGLTGDAYNQAVQNQVASGLAEKNLAAEGVSQLFKNPGQTFETIGGGSGLNAAKTLFAAATPAIMADQDVKTATPAPDRGMIRPQTFSRQQMPQDYQGQQGNIGSRERRYFNDYYTAGDPYKAAGGGLVALANGGNAGKVGHYGIDQYGRQSGDPDYGKPSTTLPEMGDHVYLPEYGIDNRFRIGAPTLPRPPMTSPEVPGYGDQSIDERFLIDPMESPQPRKPPNRGYDRQSLFKPTNPLPANNMSGASRDAYDYLMGNTNRTQVGAGPGTGVGTGTTPPTGTGRYEYDPITKQYKWIPDPIKPVDVALPVFGNPVGGGGSGGGGGYSSSPEGQAARGKYFDNMTDAERAAHADSLRTGTNFVESLLPGTWMPKVADSLQGFFKEQQHKDVMAKEAEKNEADRVKAESDNLLRMIQETNQSIYGPQVEGRTAPVTPETERVQQAIADTDFSGMDRGSTSNRGYGNAPEGRTGRDATAGNGYGPGYGAVAGGYTGGSEAAAGGLATPYGIERMAQGGIANLHQYNLGSYSDGGRLLKGPGDGVSDSIPATIGRGQPARLADGEFVIPARIVSEIGNGSTDAGARELYKMMDRIQAGRRKTVGKKQVAKNSKAVRHLPA